MQFYINVYEWGIYLYARMPGPSSSLNRLFPKQWLWLTRRWYYMTSIFLTSSKATRSPRPDSLTSLTWARFQISRAKSFHVDAQYIVMLFSFFVYCLCYRSLLLFFYYKDGYLHSFKCVSFFLHNCCREWYVNVVSVNRGCPHNCDQWIETPSSVGWNRRAIELFAGVFVLLFTFMYMILGE